MQNRSFTDLNNCKWLFIRKVGSWGGCGTGLLSVFFCLFCEQGRSIRRRFGCSSFLFWCLLFRFKSSV